ncbi:MAG: polysaccharide biosynthesis protein, partial [Dehalococcoidales bacterium]|nr:polysaccharide biosynthesis protein [Dehalococcoidales bacterium]
NIIRAIGTSRNHVETVLAVSTDKACAPVNTYGMCKAIQEKLALGANEKYPETKFICTRYGNVVGSRGSVVPLFRQQMKNGGPITITRKDMTRFLVTLDSAVNIVFDAIRFGEAGDIYVPDLKSANIMDLAEVMIGDRKTDIEIIGIRPVEKLHEVLITEEEIPRTIKKDNYYIIRPLLPGIQDNYQPVLTHALSSSEYTMSKNEIKAFLEEEGFLDY